MSSRTASTSIVALALALSGVAACASSTPSRSVDEATPLAADLTIDQLPIKIVSPVAATFDQVVDHDGSTPATFKQRYWYTTEFARGPDAPVLVYLCGEQDCDVSIMSRLADTAKSLHAAVALLEHRFYGQSMPFSPVAIADLKFLSIHQALEDIAGFQSFAKASLGFTGKWIVAGGSYAGMLAAFYRQKHPELVVGAWSSSAPVDVQETFWGYDAVASKALGPECTLLTQQALSTASRMYDDPAQLAQLSTALIGQPWQPEWGKANFLDMVSGVVVGEIQYGGGQRACAALEQHAMNPLDGVIGLANPPLTPGDDDDAPPTPPPTDRQRLVDLGPGALASRSLSRPDDQPPPPENEDFAWAAWNWQTCTEVGFFFASNPDRTQSLMPAGIDGSRDREFCDQFFHRQPDIAKTRAEYYEPLRTGQATNILYVNGSFDPWSSLSFTDPATPPPGSTVFVIAKGSHHSELVSLEKDSPLGVFEAHALFVKLAKEWLSAP